MGDRPKMSLMDINKMFSMLQPTEDEDDNGESEELNRAVLEDNHQTLESLLCQDRYKKLINRRSGWGVPSTPLRLAATWGCLRSMKVLLAHGAEVDSLDVKAQTPLFMAVSNGHQECVELLLDAGASPGGSIYNNCSPLLIAARDGAVGILQQLLDHGAEANVHARLPEWATNSVACSGPLYLAAVYGHLECFKLLLLYGADPDYNCTEETVIAQIKEPKTVLETCLRHGCRSEFIKLLIDFGANVYLPNVVLDEAAPRSEGLELLLQARAQPQSLMSQSRLAMRRLLKQAAGPQALGKLELPPVLASYLQHQPHHQRLLPRTRVQHPN
ncbi:ankyrin repeat and SOCS box protein 12 [Colius striatus]|uniref:ankyrin repeat and SOCS box protein 12 n=1 Tax=Colius striatus TaxID=57412 RepID=UPI00052A01A0|nr:ankyrin repeat and SOCS box protein 12 [Colius striatus]XP_061862899.1 ankyrin repeat and SOCS box protein 12 [Colius striatus]XP_061862900.1 ankyrin repeat and SOCS box protein 12 [Colius striatus]